MAPVDACLFTGPRSELARSLTWCFIQARPAATELAILICQNTTASCVWSF